jgi:site-specific DNA-cytosine methylase
VGRAIGAGPKQIPRARIRRWPDVEAPPWGHRLIVTVEEFCAAGSARCLGRDYATESLERFGYIPEGGNRFNLPDRLKAPCWVNDKSGSGDVMGRMHWDKPSVTIRTEFFKPEKGDYLHPTEHRAITHLEAAKLQGFPDDRLWVGSKAAIAIRLAMRCKLHWEAP